MAAMLPGISKQQRLLRRNTLIWCGLFLAAFLLIILRLLYFQGIKAHEMRAKADALHRRAVVIPATRGALRDRNGRILALDDLRRSLYADPTLVQYPDFLAATLAPVLAQPEAAVTAVLTQQIPFVWVKRGLTRAEADRVVQLGVPAIQLRTDGQRYRVGINRRQAPASDAFTVKVAQALGINHEELSVQLGEIAAPNAAEQPTAPDVVWLTQPCREEQKLALEALHFPGLTLQPQGEACSIGVDPREYLKDPPVADPEVMAARLAPLLEMTPAAVRNRLTYRPRFVWLKRDLAQGMTTQLLRLQGTIFVVKPGAILTAIAESDDHSTPEERLETAVERLDALLNSYPKAKKGQPAPPPEILVSREEIRRRLSPTGTPGVLAVKLTNDTPDLRLQRSLIANPIPGVIYGLPGISIQQERRRRYPFGTLASTTLGFVSYGEENQPRGAFGLELTQEALLKGLDGHEVKEIDVRRMTIPLKTEVTPPQDGHDVTLTLDLNIQQIVEEALTQAVTEHKALGGRCIVLDPKNGEILAMATAPSWDSNNPGNSKVPLLNPAISNYYEPGSTFKIVPVMAALEEKLINDRSVILNCGGPLTIGRRSIKESHNYHGRVTAGDLIEQSCNIGAATLALKLGPERFIQWCEKLGFGQRTGVELENESTGSLNRRNVKARITLANMGFGQSLAVTPLQMASAYAVIANNGEWVAPHLVKERPKPDGSLETIAPQRRQVCSVETAQTMLGYLERVVTGKHGTGDKAAIAGYRVGGKTGTAQKAGIGGYGNKYIASFIGVMPLDAPRLVIVTVIDEPGGSIYGGSVAAPAVGQIGDRVLRYLNVPPSPTAATTEH